MSSHCGDYKASTASGDADGKEGVDHARGRLSTGGGRGRVDAARVVRDAGREAKADGEPEELRAFDVDRRFHHDGRALQLMITGERLTQSIYRRPK
jgi:hypothetical protein